METEIYSDDSTQLALWQQGVYVEAVPQRPSLYSPAGPWQLKQDKDSLVVCPREPYEDYIGKPGGALSFIAGVTEIMCTHLTRLKLQLDTKNSHNHLHARYFGYQANTSDLPNRATEAEVVNVCRALGEKLVGLSISMCKPELTVSHLPRFVHEIVCACTSLQSFGLEDVRCCDFDDSHIVNYIGILASIARRDQPEEWTAPNRCDLRTLVISKRSGAPWRHLYEDIDAVLQAARAEQATIYHSHRAQTTGIRDPALARNMREEARELAALMMQRFPSLRRAYVMLRVDTLNKDAVDLRMDMTGTYDPVFVNDVHLAPLEASPPVACPVAFIPTMSNSSFRIPATPPQVLHAASPYSDSEASVDSDCSSESNQTVTGVFSPVDTYCQDYSHQGCSNMNLS